MISSPEPPQYNGWFPGCTTGRPLGYGATETTTHQKYFDPTEVVVHNGLNLNLVYDPTYGAKGWKHRR